MRKTLRPVLLVLTLAAVGAGAWVMAPGPFAHGIIVGAVSALVALAAGYSLMVRRLKKRMESRLAPPPLPAVSWDFAMELHDLSGGPVAATEFVGKVLILNFWATWCAPCVAEMPNLLRLHAATSDVGVNMACVSRESRETVAKFLEKRGLSAPVYLLAGDLPECFKTRGIPATFILDKRGMIALRHVGAASWDDASVIAFVRGLAATPQA
jgi:thiol-disulfide isomerase/thioredoxin